VTDPQLPRRGFPLVVPPPGGFEDAVRRGRGRRRKQTGGSSALALVLVGAIAYSVVGHGSGAGGAHLDPAQQPRVHQTRPAPSGGPQSPDPTPSATGTQPTGTPASTSASHGYGPPSAPASPPIAGPTRPPDPAHPPRDGDTSRPYAARAPITHSAPSTGTELSCLPAQSEEWCTTARGTAQNNGMSYLLEIAVCHSVAYGTADLHFAQNREADFKVVHDGDKDLVWTHSLGQPVFASAHTVTFGGGDCAVWQNVWDGYDDYGYDPPSGSYTVTGSINSTEGLLDASGGFPHD
jgi:hypothetical protein